MKTQWNLRGHGQNLNVKYILGLGSLITGRLLTYNALGADFRSLRFAGRNPSCPVCGDNPTVTTPLG